MSTSIPTPTTKFSENHTYTLTTWTVGDHTLTNIKGEEGSTVDRWRTGTLNNDALNVSEDTACWYDDTAPITYTVDWNAGSARSPEDAFEYAARIMSAANAARVFAAIRAVH